MWHLDKGQGCEYADWCVCTHFAYFQRSVLWEKESLPKLKTSKAQSGQGLSCLLSESMGLVNVLNF